MRLLLIALLLIGLAMAFSVKPLIIGTKDSGNQNLGTLNVDLTVNCDNKELTATVTSNATGQPVSGAKAYMFYTDYSYQALPNPGTTDSSGKVVMSVPGTIRFLTALFILRVDHPDFRSRETEYAYKPCFETPPQPKKNETNVSVPATPPPPEPEKNETPTPDTTGAAQPPENITMPEINETPKENKTGNGKPETQLPCLPAFALLGLAFIRWRA